MKIVHLCLASFFIDNYSYQENLLPKYHVKMGYDVTVIASLESFDEHGKSCLLKKESVSHDKNGYKIIRLNYRKPNSKLCIRLRYYHAFGDTLCNEEPDIIFIHGLQFSDLDNVVRYKKQHPHTLLFADNHADYINSAHGFISTNILHKIIWKWHIHKALPYIEKCFGVTPQRCDFLNLMYGIPNEMIDFLPMGVDDESIPTNWESIRLEICRELDIPMDSFIIMTGGKIDAKKNTHLLLMALQQLHHTNIHLLICGTIMPEMESVINPLLTDNIHLLGWCNSERVMNCMVASDIACFPGTHSTLWEQAVGVGIPAIFKKWERMEHVNVNGNCMFVKGEDIGELASTISYMYGTAVLKLFKEKAKEASKRFKYSDISKKAIGL